MRRTMSFILILGIMASRAGAVSLPNIAHTDVDANRSDTTRAIQEPMRLAQANEAESGAPAAADAERTPPPEPSNLYEPVCQTLTSAALANELPLEFLTRLIWQ